MEGLSEPSPGTLRIVYFLTRSSKIISPGQTPACAPDSGALGKLRLGSGLGGTRPSRQRSTGPSSTGSPHRGTAHPGWGRGERLGPVGGSAKGNALRRAEWNPSPLTGPPLLRQHTLNPLQKGLYGLEVVARCAKGAWAHPPALDHERDTLLQKAFLPKSYPE